MGGRPRKVQNDTEFGRAFSAELSKAGWTQTQLASSTAQTVGYVNQIMTGRRPVNAEWIETVSGAMGLSDRKKDHLIRAAAEDTLKKHGFDIDLTKRK